MGSRQLCAGERASLVQSCSPGSAGQLAGTALGTMKIPFLQAGGGEETLHPGFGAETEPEKDLQLLLFEVAAQGNAILHVYSSRWSRKLIHPKPLS